MTGVVGAVCCFQEVMVFIRGGLCLKEEGGGGGGDSPNTNCQVRSNRIPPPVSTAATVL